MRLKFLGATGTVTGSKYLLESGRHRLLVDCGLFQGLKQLRLRNRADFPVDPASVDALVLTHAHLDHSGYLPALVKAGFRGPVFCTEATLELCRLLLPDSGNLQEEEARYANYKGYSKHDPALPLYTAEDARAALESLVAVPFGEDFEAMPGLRCRLQPAGHILGAASARLEWNEGSILFSGDLGRADDVVMRPPQPPPAVDYLVMESTYGDRSHARQDVLEQLAVIISRTVARGGRVVIPAFAVGRAQSLLYCVNLLKDRRRIPDVPVYLNSPMAADVTRIYAKHHGEHRLDETHLRLMCQGVRVVQSAAESETLNQPGGPAIILSASGMATGGRVVHHIKAMAPDARNTILFAGYQAAGTRGARLLRGEPAVKIHGEYVPVHAEIANLSGMSAHADREGLLAWAAGLPRAPKRVFITHGEPEAADAFRLALAEQSGWDVEVPEYLQEIVL